LLRGLGQCLGETYVSGWNICFRVKHMFQGETYETYVSWIIKRFTRITKSLSCLGPKNFKESNRYVIRVFYYPLPMTYQTLGIMKILYIYSIQQCSSRDEFLQSKFMQDFLEFWPQRLSCGTLRAFLVTEESTSMRNFLN
jgi:hypothetical protein